MFVLKKKAQISAVQSLVLCKTILGLPNVKYNNPLKFLKILKNVVFPTLMPCFKYEEIFQICFGKESSNFSSSQLKKSRILKYQLFFSKMLCD